MTSPEAQQRRVLGLLVLGYAALYFCRSNVDAATPLLEKQFGYTHAEIGWISTASIATYAVGKMVLGALGDRVGGKRMLLLAIFGSVLATFAFGFAGGLVGYVICAATNRFFQSGGWGGLVHVASRWFPPKRYGAVMGILSASYEIGAVSTFLFCAALNEAFGWRSLFVVNPLLLGAVGVIVFFFLKGKPDNDAPPPGTPPDDAPRPAMPLQGAPPSNAEPYRGGAPRNDAQPTPAIKPKEAREPFSVVFPWLARKPAFWVIIVLSMLLTFIRQTFAGWTAVYLADLAKISDPGSTASWSIAKAAIFPAAGIIAAPLFGRLTDRFGAGRRAPLMAASLAGLVILVFVLAHAGVTDTIVAMVLIGVSGLFLLGPYSMMAGALCLDVVGKRGTATAAGLIDGTGYVAASLAGLGIGGIASGSGGWSAAFDVVGCVAFVAFAVSLGWAIVLRKRPPEVASAAAA